MAQDLTGEGKIELGDAILPLYESTLPSTPLLFHYINDHLNTSQLIVNGSGQVVWQGEFSPFGEVDVVVNQIENDARFPGQYFDAETGLHYNWHRFYDPETGRYISADPIGLAGGMNLYAYVQNDPVNWVDPWGLSPFCTDWEYSPHVMWIPTGNVSGVKHRVLPSFQIFENVVPTPVKSYETYYEEELRKYQRKKRVCYEVDECGNQTVTHEGSRDDMGETKWRDVTIKLENIPWNDPRLLPGTNNPNDRT